MHQRKAVNVKVGKHDHTAFELISDERNDVERWNEQISLLCNTEGAKLLNRLEQKAGVSHGVYRVHPHPSFGRLKSLADYVDKVVDGQQLDDSWRYQPKQEPLADDKLFFPTNTEDNVGGLGGGGGDRPRIIPSTMSGGGP